jgi:hypothetical protein
MPSGIVLRAVQHAHSSLVIEHHADKLQRVLVRLVLHGNQGIGGWAKRLVAEPRVHGLQG